MNVLLGIIAIIVAYIALLRESRHRRLLDRLQEDLFDVREHLARLERPVRSPSPPEMQPSETPSHFQSHPTVLEASESAAPPGVTTPPSIASQRAASPQEMEFSCPESVPQEVAPIVDKDWLGRLEKAAGIRWTTWVGAVVLILGVGLFVKYAFDHRWLGPAARVILGVVVGLALMAGGERFVRRQMRVLGQGLVGVGLATLYISLYAAYGFYELLPQPVVFGLMAAVTIVGTALAVVHDAMTIGVLAILGGFLTPVMLSTGRDSRDALFAYLLLLDLGVLAVMIFKRWRALDILAFVGTSLLFAGWYIQFGHAPTFSLAPTVAWLAAFYLVFLVGPVMHPLRAGMAIAHEQFLIAVANAAWMFGWSYTLLYPEHRSVLGVMTLGMAGAYLVLGILTRRRIREDDRALLGFMTLALTLAIVAIPISLDMQAVTIAWALMACVLLHLAYIYDYLPVRIGSLVPLALATGRILTIHWPLHHGTFVPFVNPAFGTAALVAMATAVYAIIHQRHASRATDIDLWLRTATAIAAAFLGLVLVHSELWAWLHLSAREEWTRWATSLVWTAGAIGFVAAAVWLASVNTLACGLVCWGVAASLCIWGYGEAIKGDWTILFNGRFLASVAACATLWVYGGLSRRHGPRWMLSEREACLISERLFGLGVLVMAAFCSAETWQWFGTHGDRYTVRCLLIGVWTLVSWALLALRPRLPGLLIEGLVCLAVACMLAGFAYDLAFPKAWVYLNARHLVSLGAVVTLLVYARACHGLSMELLGLGTLLLLVLLSVETYKGFLYAIGDPHRAAWIAQMALSILWGCFATVLLAVGFMRHVRPLRLAALGLFGLTAGKLAVVDLANIQEVYRIISFVALGGLMIGASYLYHRVERSMI